MATETILQSTVVSKFILPFLLVFFIVFAILEKTKVLGEGKQLNAITSFVISLIFVGAIFPKEVVGNLVLFLSVAIVIVFITLLLWGFVGGGEGKLSGSVRNLALGGVVVAVFSAVLWAVGVKLAGVSSFFDDFINLLFYQSWSSSFWTNVLFLAVIAIALALVLRSASGSK